MGRALRCVKLSASDERHIRVRQSNSTFAAGGACMPARNWADFLQAHYRAHLLVVDLGTRGKGTRARRLVELLGQLTESLQTTADYAVYCEEQEVKIAFESELDAKTLGKLLMARVAERGGKDWASKSVCNLDSRLKMVRRPRRRP